VERLRGDFVDLEERLGVLRRQLGDVELGVRRLGLGDVRGDWIGLAVAAVGVLLVGVGAVLVELG
jgi:hypothetical protein